MTKHLLILIAVLAAGCAGSDASPESNVVTRNDAIDDFIEVEELQEVDAIRSRKTLHRTTITERYIILSDKSESYLVTFRRRCRELSDSHVTPDFRQDQHTIRARFDTYRGCRIESIYEVNEGQADELKSLGKASGR